MPDVCARFHDVAQAIARAEADAGRQKGAVTLIAVSKTFEAQNIEPVLKTGHRIFGENRVQEAGRKWPALKEKYAGVELHLIGPLQSNKVREAVALFDVIHTVDRPSVARAIANEIAAGRGRPRLLVQVNTGEEPQKAGVAPRHVEDFVRLCRDECGLVIDGLMCIPPVEQSPGPHFALLARIATRQGLALLSMGMSSDFETAIELGATHVRIGSAIFGER